MYPDWEGSVASIPTRLYAKNRTLVAYNVRVIRQGIDLGYMILGARNDVSPIISIGLGPSPTIEGPRIIAQKIRQSLPPGQRLGEYTLIYGGPFSLAVEYEVLEGNRNLGLLTYHLQSHLPLDEIDELQRDEKYRAQAAWQWDRMLNPDVVTSDVTSQAIYSKDLPVRRYDQSKSKDNATGCGPAAGAMILNYWDERGYTRLQDDNDRADGINLMNALFDDMGTSLIGTSVTGWVNGIRTRANTHSGYNFSSSAKLWEPFADQDEVRFDFWMTMKLELTMGRPFGMWFPYGATPYHYHVVVGRGYYEDTGSGVKKFKVNTWGTEVWHNWSEVSQFDLMFVTPGY